MLTTVLNDLRESTGIKTLKKYDAQIRDQYISILQQRVANKELSTKTASNYVTALNQIAGYLNDRNLTVSAQKFGLSKGSIEYTDKSASLETHKAFMSYLNSKSDIRYQALAIAVDLMRYFGLRAREAIGITRQTIQSALQTNILALKSKDGTKNSKPRDIPVLTQAQRQVLQSALSYMRSQHTQHLFDERQVNRTQAYRFAQSAVQNFKKETNIDYHYHQERHYYAHDRLQQTNDQLTVARELGHNRLEKTYVS